LVVQNSAAEIRLPGVEVASIPARGGSAKFDLLLALAETGDGFEGSLEYASDLFDRTTAARMLDQLETLLSAALDDPRRRLADLPLLDAGARAQLLREWNDTDLAAATEALVPPHERFAAQAARLPHQRRATFH